MASLPRLFTALLLCLVAVNALGQTDSPAKPVRFIVPFPPGGPTDTLGRIVTAKLQEMWTKPVIVDYKPGGNTSVGVDTVAKSAPDGHTIGMVNSAFPILPLLRKSMPYDTLRDLAGVTQLVENPRVFLRCQRLASLICAVSGAWGDRLASHNGHSVHSASAKR